jgi:Flp pilus assembly protein TadD
VRLDPQNAEVYRDRGWAYEKKGDMAHAQADYKQADRLDPEGAKVKEAKP